ncbi:MAG: ferritin-like domain-containing protein [Candidatus Acidiferrales bacterium]
MRSNHPSCTSESESWCRHFSTKAAADDYLPWDHPIVLSGVEKRCITKSIQQFQLGEGSSGRRLLQRGLAYSQTAGDPAFVEALSLFVKEEQRHSSYLLRFMRREGIRASRSHWVDTVFRRLRVLAGLELSLRVLVSAEIIAVPYYRALRDATASPLLRAICTEILQDEATHLRFQASMLSRTGARRSVRADCAVSWAHLLFLLATCYVVWFEHHQVFRSVGYSRQRFLAEAFWEFNRLDDAVCRRLRTSISSVHPEFAIESVLASDAGPELRAGSGQVRSTGI